MISFVEVLKTLISELWSIHSLLSARFESPSAVAAQIGVVSGHVVIDADQFILSSDSDDDAESNAVPERSDSSAADTATLRSNRQKRWERLNRSLEDDLNRISVVAEDDTGEINIA